MNGLNLPAALVQLLRAGGWKRPPDVERLAAMTGVQRSDDFTFLDPNGMIRETAAGLDLVRRGQGTIYGWYRQVMPKCINAIPFWNLI